jgi:hypothetical protein
MSPPPARRGRCRRRRRRGLLRLLLLPASSRSTRADHNRSPSRSRERSGPFGVRCAMSVGEDGGEEAPSVRSRGHLPRCAGEETGRSRQHRVPRRARSPCLLPRSSGGGVAAGDGGGFFDSTPSPPHRAARARITTDHRADRASDRAVARPLRNERWRRRRRGSPLRPLARTPPPLRGGGNRSRPPTPCATASSLAVSPPPVLRGRCRRRRRRGPLPLRLLPASSHSTRADHNRSPSRSRERSGRCAPAAQ